jgi:acyl-coenzyme A synthetase/AMP-(fatty) acid ligase
LLERGFWDIWEQGKPSSFSGVPYLYELLMKLKFEDKVLPGLRYLTHAGGRLPTNLKTKIVKSCKRKRVKFYCMYGQTEAAPRMGYLPWENVEKTGCIGIPVPSGRFWLVDDGGIVIDSDEVVGELVYQGPNVGLGYAESAEDLNRSDENNGVLMTGDLAKRDSEGFYYLVGRKSRFVKLYGNRIDLDSLETLISSNGCDCACVAKGEKLRVFLTEKACKCSVWEILKRLGIHQRAVEILEIQEIPRNEFGKTFYTQLQ